MSNQDFKQACILCVYFRYNMCCRPEAEGCIYEDDYQTYGKMKGGDEK